MEFVSSSSLIPTGTHDAVSNGPRLAAGAPPKSSLQAAAPHRVVHLPLHHAAVAVAASLLPARCSYLPSLAIDKPKTNPEIFLFSTRYQPAQFLGFVFFFFFFGLQNFVFSTLFSFFSSTFEFVFASENFSCIFFLATVFFSPHQLLVFLLQICFSRL
jgi:hypothetical protein